MSIKVHYKCENKAIKNMCKFSIRINNSRVVHVKKVKKVSNIVSQNFSTVRRSK